MTGAARVSMVNATYFAQVLSGSAKGRSASAADGQCTAKIS
jgi:hypothetical protein